MPNIGFEIDYITVGENSRSGDAICLRYGNLAGSLDEQSLVVIDGGDQAAGEALAKHIETWYKAKAVDFVISTHPDADHASGLSIILEKLKVGTLLMHRPWEHASDIKGAFSDGRWSARGLSEKIEKSLRHANELETIARRKGVRIVEPFQEIATTDGSLHILGPSQEFYEGLLPSFRSTPTPKTEGLIGGLVKTVQEAVESAEQWLEDRLDIDLLTDDDDPTSAENNTSAIVLFTVAGHRLLFTGDAGKTALLKAATYATSKGISLAGLRFLHVPHHGSKRNLSSKVLRQINGSTAFISASPGDPKHPAKKVTNALKKFGASVYRTNMVGGTLHDQVNGIPRGWPEAVVEPFHSRVEA